MFDVIILSIVQGITEFLPISSSGHLAVFQKLLGFNEPMVLFDILLHIGSLVSIFVFFRKRIFDFISGLLSRRPEDIDYFKLLILGTIPAVFIGLFFDKQIEEAFTSLKMIGLSFLITSVFLLSTKFIKSTGQGLEKPSWKDALVVGLLQAMAILPGVSRSGSTITGGLWRKLPPDQAFEFSFFLAIPAILGAFVFKIKDLFLFSFNDVILGVLGMIVSAIVGILALTILQKILRSANFFWFGIYCLIIGILILL